MEIINFIFEFRFSTGRDFVSKIFKTLKQFSYTCTRLKISGRIHTVSEMYQSSSTGQGCKYYNCQFHTLKFIYIC
jgi:hypothetical protein